MSKTTAVKATTPSVITLLTSVKAIETALDSIKKRGDELQRDTHVAACSILQHVGKHKDVRLITRLLDSLPNMTRKNAVKAWFEEFGPVAFDNEEVQYIKTGKTRLGDAMGNPFWDFQPEKPYVPVSVEKLLASMISKLTKDTKETGVRHDAVIRGLTMLKEGAVAADTVQAMTKVPAPPATVPAPAAKDKAKTTVKSLADLGQAIAA
jgi:hypothetical protein